MEEKVGMNTWAHERPYTRMLCLKFVMTCKQGWSSQSDSTEGTYKLFRQKVSKRSWEVEGH